MDYAKVGPRSPIIPKMQFFLFTSAMQRPLTGGLLLATFNPYVRTNARPHAQPPETYGRFSFLMPITNYTKVNGLRKVKSVAIEAIGKLTNPVIAE